MDYKRFEEYIYKYAVEYNKGRAKAIKRVEKVQKTLNFTNEQISDIITSFDNLLSKNVYKYYPNNIRKKFISGEIYDMEWLEYKNAIEKLNDTKQLVLSKINNYILKKKF